MKEMKEKIKTQEEQLTIKEMEMTIDELKSKYQELEKEKEELLKHNQKLFTRAITTTKIVEDEVADDKEIVDESEIKNIWRRK